MMARLCRVRALNVRTRVREQVRVRGSLERGGGEPSSEADPARGRREPSSEAEPARGRREPSSEAEPTRGGLLSGPLRWAAGATAAWAVPYECV
jgi:hypothetical protein